MRAKLGVLDKLSRLGYIPLWGINKVEPQPQKKGTPRSGWLRG
jgi:hypothetical protein